MDTFLVGPWLIVGGFLAGFGLLFLGGRFDGRRPTAAAVCYALAGIAVSETSLYWLSVGTQSAIPSVLWFVVPLVVCVLAAWRAYWQRTWIKRIGEATHASFGVLPRRGIAVAHDGSADPVAALVEFDRRGHRVLGIEYGLVSGPEVPQGELATVADRVDGTYAAVQLRTPVVPSLVLTPNVGAFEPDRFTPWEDARITRNTIGSMKPDALLRQFETGTPFDRRFTVRTSDPEFARAVLTDEVRELLTGDPWFRVREVAFHGGTLWTTEAGSLTEERALTNSHRLTRLAATLPGELWNDETFRALLTDGDRSEESWFGYRPASLRTPVNRRREAAGRQPLSSLSLAVRSVLSAGLLLVGLLSVVNSAAALTGLAPDVRLTITASAEGQSRSCTAGTSPGVTTCSDNDNVSGTYAYDGAVHEVTATWWMTWSHPLPEAGDVVTVSRGPLWWHPIIEGTDTAVFLLLIGLLPLLAGTKLVQSTYLPKHRKPEPAPVG